MYATIKISPTFKDYFDELEYQVTVSSYYDIEFYLQSIHTRFANYMRQIKLGLSQESFAYLDKDLKVVEPQSFPMKKIENGDTIYIAPVVCGGGGKKGFLFAAVAVALVVATGPAGMGYWGVGGFDAAGMISYGGQYGPMGSIFGGGAGVGGGLFSGMPSFVKGMLGNLALSAIGALFTSKPKQQQMEVTKDSGTRSENNMFGSLTNSTTSGTPIGITYGEMRVAGQFLSGYILSTEHGQNDAPSIESIFVADATPLATPTPTDDS